VLIVVGVLGMLWSALAALLAANPCGAFGDACDEVGGTGSGFGGFVLGIVAFVIVAVVVVAMVETSSPWTDRSSRAR
jgi:uncharacterized membrane protein